MSERNIYMQNTDMLPCVFVVLQEMDARNNVKLSEMIDVKRVADVGYLQGCRCACSYDLFITVA